MNPVTHTSAVKARIAMLASLWLSPLLWAQTQTDRSSESGKDKEVVHLNPFEVTLEKEDAGTTVVSATRFETPNRNLPVVVDVITEQTIKEWNFTDLTEALVALSPGVSPDAAPRAAVIRGMPSDYAMRNGVPVTNFFGTAPLSRVELVRGATGVLFGITQPGGVRNMISKRPTDRPAYSVRLSADTADGYRGEMMASGPLTKDGTLKYRFGAVYQNLGSKYAMSGRYRNDHLYYPAIEWKPFPTTSIFVEMDYIYYKANGSNSVPNVRLVGSNNNLPPTPNNLGFAIDPRLSVSGGTHQNQFVRLWNFVFDQGLGDHWDLRARYSWQLYNQTNFQGVTNSFIRPGATSFNLTTRAITNRFRQEFARVDLLGRYEWNDITFKTLIGADYMWRLSSDQKIWTDATRRANGTYAANLRTVQFQDYYNQSLANNWIYDFTNFQGIMPLTTAGKGWVEDEGVYFVNQIELRKIRTHVLAGIRYDQMTEGGSTAVVNYVAQAGGGIEAETKSSHISPQLGLVYEINPKISAFINYSTSVYPNRLMQPDGSSLDPETGSGYDAGFKFGDLIGGRLTGVINFFDMYRQNLPVADPAADTDPSRAGYYVLIGEARSRGYEFNVNFRLNRSFSVNAGYVYADAFESGTRVPLVRSFKHSGNVGLNHRFTDGPLKGFNTGLLVASRSKQYFGQAGREYAPSYNTVLLRFGYPVRVFGNVLNLQVNVKNVLDKVEIDDKTGGGFNLDESRVFSLVADYRF